MPDARLDLFAQRINLFRIYITRKEWRIITAKEFNSVFGEQVVLCSNTLQRKSKEYTGDNVDRLSAFKTASALQSCSPQQALAGMLAKHIVSLYDMCFSEGMSYSLDTWNEKITDSLNYLFLLKAIVKEEHGHQ